MRPVFDITKICHTCGLTIRSVPQPARMTSSDRKKVRHRTELVCCPGCSNRNKNGRTPKDYVIVATVLKTFDVRSDCISSRVRLVA